MKKKFFIGIAMSLFAVATVFNMNISNQNDAGDISLDAITVMAQAQFNEDPDDTEQKYIASYCFCSKGSGSNYTICNLKTTCTPSSAGNTTNCRSTSCVRGCGC